MRGSSRGARNEAGIVPSQHPRWRPRHFLGHKIGHRYCEGWSAFANRRLPLFADGQSTSANQHESCFGCVWAWLTFRDAVFNCVGVCGCWHPWGRVMANINACVVTLDLGVLWQPQAPLCVLLLPGHPSVIVWVQNWSMGALALHAHFRLESDLMALVWLRGNMSARSRQLFPNTKLAVTHKPG